MPNEFNITARVQQAYYLAAKDNEPVATRRDTERVHQYSEISASPSHNQSMQIWSWELFEHSINIVLVYVFHFNYYYLYSYTKYTTRTDNTKNRWNSATNTQNKRRVNN